MTSIPADIWSIIFRMKHEIEFAKVLDELSCIDWSIRNIELAFQSYARDGLIFVEQYFKGAVGQKVTILPRFIDEMKSEVGYAWRTYNRAQIHLLASWGSGTDDDWSKNYGEWRENVGNGLFRIRIMINRLPLFRDFDAFEQLSLDHFPEFIPITVIVPCACVVSIAVPLDQHQVSVKYNFYEDVVFARKKVNAMELAKTRKERSRIITELLEFFIIKPTMLIHSYKLRESIYTKMEEFMAWTNTCRDSEYVNYIHDLVYRMSNVLSIVLKDPLCVK